MRRNAFEVNSCGGSAPEQGAWQDPTDIDICICSFRRPELVETLAGIARQRGPAGIRVRVIVADNTYEAQSRTLALLAAQELNLRLQYVHAPGNNISIARNACLDATNANWVAFIDDDEVPSLGWLDFLWLEAHRGQWDAVLGPVLAVHPHDSPAWLRDGGFHSTGPIRSGGEIKTGYTGNVLFRREFVQKAGLRFRLDLGHSGGEDDDFFYRFRDAGGTIGYAAGAVCYEQVPHARANLKWLIQRNFRAGQSHGSHVAAKDIRPAAVTIALLKAIVCGVEAVAYIAKPAARNRYLTRAALHCGVVASLTGLREIRMY